MPTTRLVVPALVLGLLAAPAVAVAQGDATPAAERAAPSAAYEPAVSDTVPYLDENGEEIGTVTVDEVIDPFEDFSEFFEVEEGSRYVAVQITLAASEGAATADEPFEARASDFGLQTVDGFFFTSTFASRDITSGDVPDLETIAIDPGDSVTGLVFYQIPAEAELARLLWQPDSGRLLVVADLRGGTEGGA